MRVLAMKIMVTRDGEVLFTFDTETGDGVGPEDDMDVPEVVAALDEAIDFLAPESTSKNG